MATRAARTFTLTRAHNTSHREHVVTDLSERDARQRVAWCGADNCRMSRTEAARLANALTFDGAPLTVGEYVFTATPSEVLA